MNYMINFKEIKLSLDENDNRESLKAKKVEIEEMRVDLKKLNGKHTQNNADYLKSNEDLFEDI